MKNNILRQEVEFEYDDIVYGASLVTYFYDNRENGHVINFNYNGVSVSESYDDNVTSFYFFARELCKIIDTLGHEQYKIYKEYKEKIRRLQKEKIIVNSKIYNYYFNDTIRSGQLVYYRMSINMQDGELVDGSSPSEFFNNEDMKSRTKTLRNLQEKVVRYYKENKVLPDDQYLEAELSESYKNMTNWINDNVSKALS